MEPTSGYQKILQETIQRELTANVLNPYMQEIKSYFSQCQYALKQIAYKKEQIQFFQVRFENFEDKVKNQNENIQNSIELNQQNSDYWKTKLMANDEIMQQYKQQLQHLWQKQESRENAYKRWEQVQFNYEKKLNSIENFQAQVQQIFQKQLNRLNAEDKEKLNRLETQFNQVINQIQQLNDQFSCRTKNNQKIWNELELYKVKYNDISENIEQIAKMHREGISHQQNLMNLEFQSQINRNKYIDNNIIAQQKVIQEEMSGLDKKIEQCQQYNVKNDEVQQQNSEKFMQIESIQKKNQTEFKQLYQEINNIKSGQQRQSQQLQQSQINQGDVMQWIKEEVKHMKKEADKNYQKKLRETFITVRKEIQALNDMKINSLIDVTDKIAGEIDVINQKLGEENDSNNKQQQQNQNDNEIANKIQNLNSRVKDNENFSANMSLKIKEEDNQIQNINKKLSQEDSQIQNITQKLHQEYSEIQNINQKLNQENDEIQNINQKLNQENDMIQNINQKLNEENEEIHNIYLKLETVSQGEIKIKPIEEEKEVQKNVEKEDPIPKNIESEKKIYKLIQEQKEKVEKLQNIQCDLRQIKGDIRIENETLAKVIKDHQNLFDEQALQSNKFLQIISQNSESINLILANLIKQFMNFNVQYSKLDHQDIISAREGIIFSSKAQIEQKSEINYRNYNYNILQLLQTQLNNNQDVWNDFYEVNPFVIFTKTRDILNNLQSKQQLMNDLCIKKTVQKPNNNMGKFMKQLVIKQEKDELSKDRLSTHQSQQQQGTNRSVNLKQQLKQVVQRKQPNQTKNFPQEDYNEQNLITPTKEIIKENDNNTILEIPMHSSNLGSSRSIEKCEDEDKKIRLPRPNQSIKSQKQKYLNICKQEQKYQVTPKLQDKLDLSQT